MKYQILFALMMLSLMPTFSQNAHAEDDTEYGAWVGHEPKDLKTLLQQFQPICERTYLPRIEKMKKPFNAADAWNKKHCECIQRFFISKDDPLFVQIVNLNLRGQLRSLPHLPPELEIYLDGYGLQQLECQKNPSYVSDSEAEMLKEQKKGPSRIKSTTRNSSVLEGLPFRPQKQNGTK